jgi:glucoamylase
MPLMWAHAEYVKLLRSLRDGEVFDHLPVVADRYLHGRGRRDLEVWKHSRQVRRVPAGSALRVLCRAPFRLRWTADDWQTTSDTDATPVLPGVAYVDLPTASDQRAPLRFTFFWPATGQWEERDYAVEIASG